MVTSEALIIQFKTDGTTPDFDRLVALEDTLIRGYAQNRCAEVDGHDFGSGTMNIFILPKRSWAATIEVAFSYLKHHRVLDYAIIAKRLKSERHVVIWPKDFEGVFRY